MIILIFALIFGCKGEDVSYSADLLLGDVNAYLDGLDLNFLRLPNINIFGLQCRNGSYGDISTIYRAGPVKALTTSDFASFKGSFGLETFKISYPECRVLGFFKQNFQLNVSPTVYFQFDIRRKGHKCFGKLKDISINLTRMNFISNRRFIGLFEKLLLELSFFLSKNTIIRYLQKEILVYSEKYKKGYSCTKSL